MACEGWIVGGLFGAALAAGCGVAPPPEAPSAAEPTAKTSGPSSTAPAARAANAEEDAARDDRRARRAPRARALLVSEIQGLERLGLASTRTSPDRPALLRRIAEANVELAASATKDGSSAVAQAAHKNAVRHYVALLSDHPDAPARDAALYNLGLEYEALGDLTNARKVYFDVVKSHAGSPYVAKAYFAFGVLFRQEGKLDLARQAFAQAAQGAEAGSSLQTLASREAGGAEAGSTTTTTTGGDGSGPKIVIESSLGD